MQLTTRINKLGAEITEKRKAFREMQLALNEERVVDGFADLASMDAELIRMDEELKPIEERRNKLVELDERDTDSVMLRGQTVQLETPDEAQTRIDAMTEYNRSVAAELGMPFVEGAGEMYYTRALQDHLGKPIKSLQAQLAPTDGEGFMLNGLLEDWFPSSYGQYTRAAVEGTGIQGVTATGAERLQGAVPWLGYTPQERDIRGLLSIIRRRSVSTSPLNFSIQTEKLAAENVAEATAPTFDEWRSNKHTINLQRVRALTKFSEEAGDSVPEFESILREDMRYAIEDRWNQQLIQGDGTGFNLTGFSSDKTTNTARLFGMPVNADANRINSASIGRQMWNSINDAEKSINVDGDAMISHAVVHPDIFYPTRVDFTTGAGWTFANPADPLAMRAWGTPIVISTGWPARAADALAMICGDFVRYALSLTKGDVMVEIGRSGTDYETWQRTMRASVQTDLVITRPRAFFISTWLS